MREEHIAVLGQFCAEDITNFSRLQYTSTLVTYAYYTLALTNICWLTWDRKMSEKFIDMRKLYSSISC